MMQDAFPPDEVYQLSLSAQDKRQADAVATLAECQAYTNALIGKIRGAITSCLSECNAVGSNCHSCISGRVTLALNQAEAVKSKCLSKVVNAIRSNLGEAYWYGEKFIGPVPTLEELQYIAAGGIPQQPTQNTVGPSLVAGGTGAGDSLAVVQPVGNPPPVYPYPPTQPPIYNPHPVCDVNTIDYCPEPTPVWPPIEPPPPYVPPIEPQPPTVCPPQQPACPPPIINIPPCPPCGPQPQPIPQPPPGMPPPGMPPPGFKICPDGQTYSEGYPCPEPEPPPEPIPPEPVPPIIVVPPIPQPPQPNPPCADVAEPVCIGPAAKVWELYFPEWNAKHCPSFEVWEQQSAAYEHLSSGEVRGLMREQLGLQLPNGEQVMPEWIQSAVSALPTSLNVRGESGFIGGLLAGSGLSEMLNPRAVVANMLWRAEDVFCTCIPAAVYVNLPRFESCDAAPAAAPWMLRFLVGFIEEWLGEGVSELRETLSYQVDYWCPSELIGTGDTHELYARGFIDTDTWRCWIRANNLMDKPQELVAKAREFSLSAEQVLSASARGIITPETERSLLVNARLKDATVTTVLRKLKEQLPALPESLRMALRETDSDDIAEKYGLDDGFNMASVSPYQEWIAAAETTPERVQNEYRLQWRMPGIMELAQMVFRLRSDSQDADNVPLSIDREDIEQLYKANAIPEYWRERLLAIARPVVGIRYLHMLIRFADWSSERVTSSLIDEGWSESNAKEINSALQDAEYDRVFRELSVLSPHDVGRAYAGGYISRAEATQSIVSLGYSPQQASVTLSQADTLRTLEQRKEIVKVVEQQFKAGAIDRTVAMDELVAVGIPQDQAAILAQQWEEKQQKAGKPAKEFSASELCTLWSQGVITAEDYYSRLIGIGWTAEDAIRITTSCGIKLSAKQSKGGSSSNGKPKPKERKLSVAELCTLMKQGLIDEAFYYKHMLALGFTGDDSTLLLTSCKEKAAGKVTKGSVAAGS